MNRTRICCVIALAASVLSEASAQSLLYTVHGDAAQDFLGGAISGRGDFDGDGVGDLVMTHRLWTSVRVISGRDGRLLDVHAPPGGVQIQSMSATSDIDQDGHADLLLGDENAGSAGLVQLLSGRDFSVLQAAFGDASGDELGSKVVMLGDLDGDGRVDYAAGAPQKHFTFSGLGYIRAYSGMDGSALWTVYGDYPSGEVGWSAMGTRIAGAGDLDGDGRDDVIAGMPGYSGSPGLYAGRARAYSGADGATLHDLPAAFSCQLFGSSVAGLRDLDGDGHAEFAVGAPTDFPIFCGGPGLVYVHSGQTGAALFTCVGPSGGKLGETTASTQDVNGDDVPDILSAERTAGIVKVFSGVDGAQLLAVNGVPYHYDLVVVGDLNDDGFDEFLVANAFTTKFGSGTGSVWLYSLATVECGATILEGGAGCPGTAAKVPRLALRGCAAEGSLSLNLTNALGGAQAFVVLGTGVVPGPFPVDVCVPLVEPIVSIVGITLPPGGAGDGWFGISAHVPAGIPTGTRLAAQVFVADPGAVGAFSGSNFVEITFS